MPAENGVEFLQFQPGRIVAPVLFCQISVGTLSALHSDEQSSALLFCHFVNLQFHAARQLPKPKSDTLPDILYDNFSTG